MCGFGKNGGVKRSAERNGRGGETVGGVKRSWKVKQSWSRAEHARVHTHTPGCPGPRDPPQKAIRPFQHTFNKTCPKGVLFPCWWVECTAYAPRHCAPPLQTTGLCSPSPSVRAPVPDRVEGCRLDPARASRQARTRRADGFGGWEAKAVRRADSQPRARRGRRRVGTRRAWTPVAGSGSDAATSSEPVANTRFEWGRCEE